MTASSESCDIVGSFGVVTGCSRSPSKETSRRNVTDEGYQSWHGSRAISERRRFRPDEPSYLPRILADHQHDSVEQGSKKFDVVPHVFGIQAIIEKYQAAE